MVSLFIGITCVNLLALSAALVLGYLVKRDPTLLSPYHQLAGVLAALTCVAVHCIVFTYFMATSKWVQHAIAVKRLDPALATPTRSLKARAFPAALLAMGIVFVTAITGVATFGGYGARWLHHALAITSLVINALVAVIEYRAIERNGRLIDRILASISSTATV